jgi:hypothetical protein
MSEESSTFLYNSFISLWVVGSDLLAVLLVSFSKKSKLLLNILSMSFSEKNKPTAAEEQRLCLYVWLWSRITSIVVISSN